MQTQVKLLSGNSGCKVWLCTDDKGYYVHKVSASVDYNQRLISQYRKQLILYGMTEDRFKTPKIFDHGYEGNLFYFDMAFVKGNQLSFRMDEMSPIQITSLTKLYFSYIHKFKHREEHPSETAAKTFNKKIQEVELSLIDFQEEAIRATLLKLKGYDFSYIPKTFCLGDLTLENIIVTPDSRLYLIDLLDSFYNSWYLDVAKLLFDLTAQWSFRSAEPNSNRDLRCIIARKCIEDQILSLSKGKEILKDITYLISLHILRILPYLKSNQNQEKQLLIRALEKNLAKL